MIVRCDVERIKPSRVSSVTYSIPQWSAIKERLSNGMEGVRTQHMRRSKEEDIVHIACPKCQSCGIAPRGSRKGTKEAVFPEKCDGTA